MKEIDIHKVIRVVDLLKQVNNANSCLVSEVAKEMGVKKTDLMEFINENTKLFLTVNSPKGKSIRYAYPSAECNHYTEEWLAKAKRDYAKTIYVSQWNCYGQLENYYVTQDANSIYDNSCSFEDKKYLWRNTAEKMDAFIKSGHFFAGIGSTGMFTGTSLPYCLKVEHMKALVDEGWTIIGENIPASIKEYQNK